VATLNVESPDDVGQQQRIPAEFLVEAVEEAGEGQQAQAQVQPQSEKVSQHVQRSCRVA